MCFATSPANFLIQSIKAREARFNVHQKQAPLFPCSICNYDVAHNDKSILCSTCDHWIHIKCNSITIEEYKCMQERKKINPDLITEELWTCLSCELKRKAEYTPFLHLTPNQINNLNSLDSMAIIDLLPEDEISHNAINTNNIIHNNLDAEWLGTGVILDDKVLEESEKFW